MEKKHITLKGSNQKVLTFKRFVEVNYNVLYKEKIQMSFAAFCRTVI